MSPLNKLTAVPRIDSRLAAYATLTGVALAAPAATQADIIWSGPVNINIPTTLSGVYINVATGGFSATPASVPGWDINPWGSASFFVWANNAASPTSGIINNFAGGTSATLTDNLPLGALIDGSYTFGRTDSIETSGATGFQLSSSNNYIGFRFFNESTAMINYGWMHFSLSSAFNGQPRTVLDFAFDNAGLPLNVGQTSRGTAVPESGSTLALLGLFSAGALGVRTWRKSKAA